MKAGEDQKPELIVISQYAMGGGASFHRNMLANFPKDFFDLKCIYLDPVTWSGARLQDVILGKNDVIFTYGSGSQIINSRDLSPLISNREGVLVANLEDELVCLDLHPKKNKTVYFICHDAGFLPLPVKYQSLIDVFIAHNITVFNEMKRLVPNRAHHMHFIEHGVKIPTLPKREYSNQKLKIVFLARHHEFKGIFDLPVINDLLVQKGIEVDWMILGDGPDRPELIRRTEKYSNFQFQIPVTTDDVLNVLKTQDVFILPSRNDGLPVALLESMSTGCVPVIANFSEGIKRVVSDDIGFVLPVGDNAAFADKLALLANDSDLRKTLSQNCIQKVKDEFNIETQALKYFTLYKQYKQLKVVKRSRTPKDLYRRAQYRKKVKRMVAFANRVWNKVSRKK